MFPAILGLLGLMLAWRRGVDAFGFPAPVVDIAVGMVTLLFFYAIGAYLAKVMFRAGVVGEDLKTLPGRTGLSALMIGLMAEAALLAPHAPALASILVAAGLAGLLGIALHVLPQRLRGTDTAGPMTPAMHLVFVGFVVAPGAMLPLGLFAGAVPYLLWYCLAAALLIAAMTIAPLAGRDAPPPLRPLQVIQIAPPAFLATGAFATDQTALGTAALVWATAVFVVLAVRVRWLTAGEFSGFWAAFTFPLTAYASALMVGAGALGSPELRVFGGIVLVAATLIIPPIAYRIIKLWATGMLGAKTNAAIA